MSRIKVERGVGEDRLRELGVRDWPVWSKEASEFPWRYEEAETCYFLEGKVTVIPEGEGPVAMGRGDLVTFPRGMSCTWKITRDVRKHYKFGDREPLSPQRGSACESGIFSSRGNTGKTAAPQTLKRKLMMSPSLTL